MMNYTWTDEDVKLVEKFIDIKNRGFYCDGNQLTQVYNRVLHKSVNPTNCGSCIRQRINELETALNNFKAKMAQESVLEVKPNDTKVEVKEEATEAGNDEIKACMAKVRAARKVNKK